MRLWYSLNARYCRASAYLASQRGDAVGVADFESRAEEWVSKIDRLDINRRS